LSLARAFGATLPAAQATIEGLASKLTGAKKLQ
jgi:hypothetical protein